MEKLQWIDSYNLGIRRIDYQHQYFLELINWLSYKLEAIKNSDLGQRYIEELLNYSPFHFFSEETLMLEIGFPELKAHQEQHRELVNHLSQVSSRLEMGEIEPVELIHFLFEWFVNHTAEEDCKIAKFLGRRTCTEPGLS